MTKNKIMEIIIHNVVTVTAGNLSSIIEGYSLNVSSLIASFPEGVVTSINKINLIIQAMATDEKLFCIQAYAAQHSGSITMNAQATNSNPFEVLDLALGSQEFTALPIKRRVASRQFNDHEGIWINTIRLTLDFPASMLKAINNRLATKEPLVQDIFTICLVALASEACSYGGETFISMDYTTKQSTQKFR